MSSISIVIPILNEKKNLKKLSSLIVKNVNFNNYEIIFVDDNSTDGSDKILKLLSKKYKKIKHIIRRSKVKDLSKSCIEGFKKSIYKNILVMDGDLQHDPKDINKLVESFKKNNADIVVGSRNLFNSKNRGLGFFRLNASKLLILLVKFLLGEKTNDPMSGFFLFKKDLLKKTKKMNNVGYKILLDILYSTNTAISVVDVDINFKTRKSGYSKMSLKVLVILIYVIMRKLLRL